MKVVGVKFLGSDKVYYYFSNKEYRIGQVITIRTPNSGDAEVEIVEVNSNVRVYGMKQLQEV